MLTRLARQQGSGRDGGRRGDGSLSAGLGWATVLGTFCLAQARPVGRRSTCTKLVQQGGGRGVVVVRVFVKESWARHASVPVVEFINTYCFDMSHTSRASEAAHRGLSSNRIARARDPPFRALVRLKDPNGKPDLRDDGDTAALPLARSFSLSRVCCGLAASRSVRCRVGLQRRAIF